MHKLPKRTIYVNDWTMFKSTFVPGERWSLEALWFWLLQSLGPGVHLIWWIWFWTWSRQVKSADFFIAKARSALRRSYLGRSSNVCRRILSSLSMKWKAMAHSSKLLLIKFLKIQCFEIQDEWVLVTSASVLEDEIDKTVTMLYRMDTWSIKRCALTVSSTCHTSHFEPDQVTSWAMLWWGKCLKLGLWAT